MIVLNKSYDAKKEKNEKLAFLNNPITRPFALVENQNDNEVKESEPMQSLATASRLANIQRSDNENVQESNKIEQFSSKEGDNEKTSKSNIIVDFENLNDDIGDQGQLKDDSIYDNRSSQNLSKDIEFKDSLTFRPEGMLKTPQDISNTPVSFGGANMLHSKKNEHEYDE